MKEQRIAKPPFALAFSVGPGAYDDIAAVCPAYGKKAAVIGGKHALVAAGDVIVKAARGAGIEGAGKSRRTFCVLTERGVPKYWVQESPGHLAGGFSHIFRDRNNFMSLMAACAAANKLHLQLIFLNIQVQNRTAYPTISL